MSSTRRAAIQAPLGRRDNGDQAEHILVSLDTFLDRRTAVVFGVTASGVRLDRFHSERQRRQLRRRLRSGLGARRPAIDADGWTAELWIPFSQLRFNPRAEQIWGLNMRRFRPTLDEEDYWVLIPRTERAWSSRFGDLRGIAGIVPPRRIECCRMSPARRRINATSRSPQPVRRWQEPRGASAPT